MNNNEHISKEELEYLHSLDRASVNLKRGKSRMLLYVSFLTIFAFIVWSAFAMIDETTTGTGKVIPSSQIQKVQSLEGGIVSEILIKDGMHVSKDQPLIKLNDVGFASNFDENQLRFNELRAKACRFQAESTNKPFVDDSDGSENLKQQMKHERSLYQTNLEHLNNVLSSTQEQILQAQQQLEEVKAKKRELTKNYKLITEQIKITKPLVAKGVVSEIDYIKLRREANTLYGEMRSSELSIPRLKAVIDEKKKNKKELRLNFRSNAKEELNKVISEMSRIKEKMSALNDKVKRATLRSPVDGTIKRILVSTIGEVVQPGADLVEIVSSDDNLVIEAKIKPSDIAFLHPDQEVVVKFTAYDFVIYGGLKGRLYQISPDSILDEKGNTAYLVRITTDKTYLGTEEDPLKIIPGMTTNIEILTGKRSVLQFLLKPILRAKANAFRER